MARLRVGVDIGGTFTDIVFLNETGEMHFGKTLTTYPDPSIGVLKGLSENLKKYQYTFRDIQAVIHGTTLVTNALIERKGVKTALITTKGFRDQIEIGNENRYDLYDLFLDKPTPLVPRHLRFTVTERILADGEVLEILDENEVKNVLSDIHSQGVEAVAVCLLHSYKNPSHEKKILEIATEMFPDMRISISSEVSPEIREYQRSYTTIANVYVQPLVEEYLVKLERELENKGFDGQFYMMLSSGGTCTVETACRFPIRILESGPVGGAMAAALHSKLSSLSNLLAFDMGGTTAKASLINEGMPQVANEFEVGRESRFRKGSGIPVKVPVIEMIEIGAGGGSIAHVDRLGLIKVGPQSAGSKPGPVCYGKGGTMPTVTDADLVLGYLNPHFFLGGEMSLDVDAAYEAIKKQIADPLGIDVVDAALGIHRIVNENMASAARIHAVEKGKNVQDYALFATGGAGPVHACNVAKIAGISKIISPVGAGVCSAFGFLTAPLSFDFAHSYAGRLDRLNWEEVTDLLQQMEKRGETLLTRAGIAPSLISTHRSCEMRYVGQTHEITVPIPNGVLSKHSIAMIEDNFRKQYEDLYTEASQGMPIEALNWRVVVQGPTPSVSIKPGAKGSALNHEPKSEREVYFEEYRDFQPTPVYDRAALTPGASISGPAVIEERESTMVIVPGFNLRVDSHLNLVIQKEME